MGDLLESILQRLIEDALGEGQRALKARALSGAIRVIRAIRALAVINSFLNIGMVMTAVSSFTVLLLCAGRLQDGLSLYYWPLAVSVLVALASGWSVYSLLREKTWVAACRLDELVEKALSLEPGSAPGPTESGVDYALMERMIERTVQKMVDQRLNRPPPPEASES